MQTKKIHTFLPWIIWALGSSFVFYKYVLEVSPSIMAHELMRDFSLSGTALGNLAACYFYAYLAMQLPVGLLLDRFGPRRLITIAIAVCAGAALLFSQATSIWQADLARVLIGLAGAFSAVGTMKLVTIWFEPRRFALLAGLMMTAAMLGAVFGQAPLAIAIEHVGWRTASMWVGVAGFVVAVMFWLAARDHQIDDGSVHTIQERGFFTGLKKIAANPQSWLIAMYSGLAFAPISAFAGLWGIPYLMEAYDYSRPVIAGLTSLTFVGFAIGAPLSGWYSDRIMRRKPVMVFGTIGALLCLLVVLYVPGMRLWLLGSVLFVMGICISFFFVSFAHMRELNAARYAGTSIGFINMFNALCGALSEPLIGKILDLGWHGAMQDGARYFSVSDYQGALIALPIGLVIAIILLCFIKETHCKQHV
ncbi:MAG: MFS transporter [Gammaproteobacteria bacterium]|nr:MFS transporter [Gammaproteobacteria bacterium]